MAICDRPVWTERALLRLQQIQDYIAEDQPKNAQHWITRLLDRGDSLSDQPHRGRPVPEYSSAKVREVREGDYRIIYRLLCRPCGNIDGQAQLTTTTD